MLLFRLFGRHPYSLPDAPGTSVPRPPIHPLEEHHVCEPGRPSSSTPHATGPAAVAAPTGPATAGRPGRTGGRRGPAGHLRRDGGRPAPAGLGPDAGGRARPGPDGVRERSGGRVIVPARLAASVRRRRG